MNSHSAKDILTEADISQRIKGCKIESVERTGNILALNLDNNTVLIAYATTIALGIKE